MKAPSLDDKVVPVTAYLTDEVFGYDHWRAAQFASGQNPISDHVRPAVLVLCTDATERAQRLLELASGLGPAGAPAPPQGDVELHLTLALQALQRLQERAYADARGRDIADTVIGLQELTQLLRALRVSTT